MEQAAEKKVCPARKWTKRVGWGAFLFFFIKGLGWLIVPAVLAYYYSN